MSEYGLAEVSILGRVGADPELRYLPSGVASATIRVAVTRPSNKNQTRTIWLRCMAFGDRAENLAKLVTKGRRLFIKGQLNSRKVERDNVKYTTVDIWINEWFLVDPRPNSKTVDNADSYISDANFPEETKSFDMEQQGSFVEDIPF